MKDLTRWLRCALRPCRPRTIGGRIFLCYRHDDSALETTVIQGILRERFGRRNVFRDIDIPLGEDYREAIRRELDSCFAVLVIIGRTWLSVTDEAGHRRIDDPRDMLRREVEIALESDARTRVIPVLVDGAQTPHPDQLPESIRRLAYRISCEVSTRNIQQDTQDRVISRLETPRHSRFGSWGDVRGPISTVSGRRVPLAALIAHALWRPILPNAIIPISLVVFGLSLRGAGWLLVLAPILYLGLALVTLFDLGQSRCVRECMREMARARERERIRTSSSA